MSQGLGRVGRNGRVAKITCAASIGNRVALKKDGVVGFEQHDVFLSAMVVLATGSPADPCAGQKVQGKMGRWKN